MKMIMLQWDIGFLSIKRVSQDGFSRYRDKHESAGMVESVSMECG